MIPGTTILAHLEDNQAAGRGALPDAAFRKRIEELRIKRQNDMEVTAHEIAHMLDDRHPEIRAQFDAQGLVDTATA